MPRETGAGKGTGKSRRRRGYVAQPTTLPGPATTGSYLAPSSSEDGVRQADDASARGEATTAEHPDRAARRAGGDPLLAPEPVPEAPGEREGEAEHEAWLRRQRPPHWG